LSKIINVAPRINATSRKFDKKNKRSPLKLTWRKKIIFNQSLLKRDKKFLQSQISVIINTLTKKQNVQTYVGKKNPT
jgi:hypothetical protein